MGNLFSKKKPVVDEPTETTPGENADGTTSSGEAKTAGVTADTKNQDGVTSEGSTGDPNKLNQVDTTVENISIEAESINLEASAPAVSANLEGGVIISPDSENQNAHGSAGHPDEAVTISPESVNQSTHGSAGHPDEAVTISPESDNQSTHGSAVLPEGVVNISPMSPNQGTHGSAEHLEGGSSNEAVSVEHSERFRTESRTKVTTPIEALELSLSGSPQKAQDASIAAGHNNLDATNPESPIIEQFEHITLESAHPTESKPDAHLLHNENTPATKKEIELGGSIETPKVDAAPESENSASLLIDFGEPVGSVANEDTRKENKD